MSWWVEADIRDLKKEVKALTKLVEELEDKVAENESNITSLQYKASGTHPEEW